MASPARQPLTSLGNPSSFSLDEPATKKARTDIPPEEVEEMRHVVLNEYKGPKKNPVRVWCDGCFDLMHWGHANALRQAKENGDILVVGVHSDAAIRRHKGPPVMNERERYDAVAACKWADEIVENAPYRTYLSVLEQYNIDFCVHGEDLSVDENGKDTYHDVKQAGKYKQIKRSEGVSTTEIVGRMILCTKNHLTLSNNTTTNNTTNGNDNDSNGHSFLPTSRTLMLFSAGPQLSREPNKRIYIDGAFDLFHVGHADILKRAKAKGDYLIVGVHDDQTVNRIQGSNFPILNMYERVLSVLACRFVDEVVIGAPYYISKEQLKRLTVQAVVHNEQDSDYDALSSDQTDVAARFQAAKDLSIYDTLNNENANFLSLSTTSIMNRIIQNRLLYEERNRKKAKGVEEINQQQFQSYYDTLKGEKPDN